MKRNKKESYQNTGFYIAVCCCVLVIAIVGYVSKTATKKDTPAPQQVNPPILEVADLPELTPPAIEVPAEKTEDKKPQRVSVPVEEESSPVAFRLFAEDPAIKLEAPVSGKIIGAFSGDNLVYHETSGDWRTHNGTDFAAEDGEIVKASADGVVESIACNTLGNCVTIDHGNGFKTVYANLGEVSGDLLGTNVKAGDEIARISSSALSDLSQGAHLHFEVFKEDERVDPTEYLK